MRNEIVEFIIFIYMCGMTCWLVHFSMKWLQEMSKMWMNMSNKVIDIIAFIIFILLSFVPMALYVFCEMK